MENAKWTARILRTMEYIHCHLGEEIDAPRLAEMAGFSLHHFHRVFRGVAGESVMEYTRRLRLEQAAMHLKFGQEQVVDVALRSGYESHEGFTRAFTARFGVPPGEYRAAAHIADSDPRQFRVKEYGESRCLADHHIGRYDDCGPAWQKLFSRAMPHRVPRRLDQPKLGLCYDDPEVTDPARCRYEACAVLAGAPPAELPEGFLVRTIPSGTYAQSLHRGPYRTIADTYVALLGQWLPRRGVELPDEPVVEAYLNSPLDTPLQQLLTEVRVRIRP